MISLCRSRLLFATSLLLFAGCGGQGSSSRATLTKVTGAITLDGKPLANAKVFFYPIIPPLVKNPPAAVESQAMTDAQGKFSLQAIHGGEGAMPGRHKVVIKKMVMIKDGADVPQTGDPALFAGLTKEVLVANYSSLADSKLIADVPSSGGEVNFQLTRKP